MGSWPRQGALFCVLSQDGRGLTSCSYGMLRIGYQKCSLQRRISIYSLRICMLLSHQFVQSVAWRRLRHLVLLVFVLLLVVVRCVLYSIFCSPSIRVSMFGGDFPNDFGLMIFTYFVATLLTFPGFLLTVIPFFVVVGI